HDVGVERPSQRAVRGDQDDQSLTALAGSQQRVVVTGEDRGQVGQDLVELLAVWPGREGRILGALQFRRRHELHGARDLLDVLDGSDPAPDIALASHATPRLTIASGWPAVVRRRLPMGGLLPAARTWLRARLRRT